MPKSPLILRARREVRSEQDARAVEARHRFEHVLDLGLRNALEAEPFLGERAQDIGVPVRLERIEHVVDPGQRLERARLLLQRRAVIDERLAVLPCHAQQIRTALVPPLPRRDFRLGGRAVQLFPGGSQHAIEAHLADRNLVQTPDEPISLLLVDDERDVEIVRGLGHEIDLLLFEELERFAETVEDRPDVAAHETDCGARSDDLHATQLRQIEHERIEPSAVERVRRGIQGHRHARLGRGDEVDGNAVLLEHLECIREETDGMPHADRLHRDQRDVLLDRDGLHLRRDVAAVRRDDRAFELRRLRRVDVERNAVLLHGHDAAGMKHFRPGTRDFLRLVILERSQQARSGHRARICAEHAWHVREGLETPCLELGGKVSARGVRAAASEQHGIAVFVARNEALRDPHRAGARPALLQLEVRLEGARRGQISRSHRRVLALLGLEHGARVDPLHVESLRREKGRPEACRHQLALRHHARAQAFADLAHESDTGGDLPQALELLFEISARCDPEIACEIAMPLLDLLHHGLPIAAQRMAQELLEPVGNAGQRRMDDDGT